MDPVQNTPRPERAPPELIEKDLQTGSAIKKTPFSNMTFESIHRNNMIVGNQQEQRPEEYFSSSFGESEQRFLSAAGRLNAEITSYPVSAKGPGGEELKIHIAKIGPASSTNALLHISGTHGIEGFTGAAIQLAILNALTKPPNDCTLYFLHGLNPYGMAFYRRVNESNVDLNRNCVRQSGEREVPAELYAKVNSFLNPEGVPSRLNLFYLKAFFYVLRYGFTPLKRAVAEGQYKYPDGIYYGGRETEESLLFLEKWFQSTLSKHQNAAVVDIHTGLGDYGKDILMTGDNPPHELSTLCKKFLGQGLYTTDPEKGAAYSANGELATNLPPLVPSTNVYWILQEFGTYGNLRVVSALIDEHRWHRFGNGDTAHWSRQKLFQTFNPPDPEWRESVIKRGLEVFKGAQALLQHKASS